MHDTTWNRVLCRLHDELSFGDPNEFTSQEDIWSRYSQMLNAYKDLVYSEIGLAATYTRAMEEMYEDNVQYMELRTEISNVRNR